MKKTFIVLSTGILLFAGVTVTGCGGGDKPADKETTTTAEAAPAAPVKDPAVTEGLELIGKSDCLTCHKVNEAGVGPAYSLVAERYAGNQAGQDSLALKIIKGGAGNWGEIAMPPHPTITEADAKKMVTYVMSLKP